MPTVTLKHNGERHLMIGGVRWTFRGKKPREVPEDIARACTIVNEKLERAQLPTVFTIGSGAEAKRMQATETVVPKAQERLIPDVIQDGLGRFTQPGLLG